MEWLSMGGLIPLWILGAPLLGGFVALATLPKHSSSDDRNTRMSHTPLHAQPVGAGRM